MCLAFCSEQALCSSTTDPQQVLTNSLIFHCLASGHANKNTSGQLCSMLRTCTYGEYWADVTLARSHGLPPAAYSREEPMSDKLNSLLTNPFFLVEEVDGRLNSLVVPWALRGATVHNVVCAMALAPALHRDLTLLQRCELGLTAFLSLDIFRMISSAKCREKGLPTGPLFMAPQTVFNLQGVALSVIAMCVSKPKGWTPWKRGSARASELTVEQFFSFIRAQSSNSQHTARSYWTAATRQNLRTGARMNKNMKADSRLGYVVLIVDHRRNNVHLQNEWAFGPYSFHFYSGIC